MACVAAVVGIGALLSATPLSHANGGERTGSATVERRLWAMGTWLAIEVRAEDRDAALAASERAVRSIESVEARLSTWREDSELARLNRSPVDEEFTLSEETAADLTRARSLWVETDGAFDPGVGALVRAWGLRSGGRLPAPDELAQALDSAGFAALELRGRIAIRRHRSLQIEEGGFAKGVGLDAALRELANAGVERAVLDLGGQIAFLGEGELCVELADPRDRERGLLEVRIAAGSFSTSGNSERGIAVEGERFAHILDPRSGLPAADFGTLSTWAEDATTADALSKLYVLGPDGALAWAAERDGAHILVVEVGPQGLRVRASSGWRGRLAPLVPDLEIEFR